MAYKDRFISFHEGRPSTTHAFRVLYNYLCILNPVWTLEWKRLVEEGHSNIFFFSILFDFFSPNYWNLFGLLIGPMFLKLLKSMIVRKKDCIGKSFFYFSFLSSKGRQLSGWYIKQVIKRCLWVFVKVFVQERGRISIILKQVSTYDSIWEFFSCKLKTTGSF